MGRISKKTKNTVSDQNEILVSKTLNNYDTALYVRLSDEESADDETNKIENQKEMLLRFVESKPDLQLVKLYCDNGRTGRNFNRPEWIRLMSDMKDGKINCIVVKDLSRLGRNYIETGNYLEKVFPFIGVRFIAVADGYDSIAKDSNLDELMLPLKNIINDAYSKDLSKKIRSARKIQRSRGEFTGGTVAYGYIRDRQKKGHLVIDRDKVHTVKMIFQFIADGYSYSKVAKMLNELNIPSPKQGKWNYQQIRQMTGNKVYIGNLIQGVQCVGQPDISILSQAHEAIIDKELFMAVQKRRNAIYCADLERRKQSKSIDLETYLFRGLLITGNSGKTMYPYHYYKGNGQILVRAYVSPRCLDENGVQYKLVQIREETLLDCVSATLKQYVIILGIMEEYMSKEKAVEFHKKKLSIMETDIKYLNERLRKSEEYLADLYEDMVERRIEQKNYLMFREKYLSDAKMVQADLDRKIEEREEWKKVIDFKNPYIKYLKQFGSDRKITRNIIKLLIEKIIVMSPTKVEIKFKFIDEFKRLESHYVEVQMGGGLG